jgi:hypothetical protein
MFLFVLIEHALFCRLFPTSTKPLPHDAPAGMISRLPALAELRDMAFGNVPKASEFLFAFYLSKPVFFVVEPDWLLCASMSAKRRFAYVAL